MRTPKLLSGLFLLCASLSLTLVVACGTDSPAGGRGPVKQPPTAPAGPQKTVSATEQVPAALAEQLRLAAATDASSLTERYAPPSVSDLSYDPTTASGLDLIQQSSLALSPSEMQKLKTNGLVISKNQGFPSFAYGYKSIYLDDLPVYVSADSILEAVHRTFDSLLERTEEQVLVGELRTLLEGMRVNLLGAFEDPQLTADLDLYLGVAEALLKQQAPQLLDSGSQALATQLYELGAAANGHEVVKLFGSGRDEDFSQFEPRGHYTDSPVLGQYFKAMMWLGRVDLRLIETQSNGTQVFYRRQFDAALALRELMGEKEKALWEHIDTVIGTYVGEHDSMTPADMGGLMAALGVASSKDAAKLSDQEVIDELARGGWGAQRIASRIIIKGSLTEDTLPLDRSFLIFGQRYTVDSHTFVNVTYDRIPDRLMPKPLDAAFAALGNNAALPILEPEFTNQ
ncbi:MAG: hypothetical protein RJA70_2943, partial [Pseudomonadota bacterium]